MNGWTKENFVPCRALAVIVMFFAAPVGAAEPPRVAVESLDDGTLIGGLVSLTDGRLLLDTAEGEREVPLARVLFVSPEQAPPAPAAVVAVWAKLVDGSTLLGTAYLVEDNRARFTALDGGQTMLPTESIAHVRLRDQTPDISAQWEQILAAEADGDLIVIRKNEAVDYLSGRLGDVTSENVEFTLEGETTPVRRARVDGLVYFHAQPPKLTDAVCRVALSGGGEWFARELMVSEGRLKLETPAGVSVDVPWEQVAQLDFSLGKVAYLSDLPTQSEEWTPYFGVGGDADRAARLFGPRRDQALFGQPLILEGTTYRKGLALHSRSQMVWRLPSKFSNLEMQVGLAERGGRRDTVRLTIEADGRVLFDETIAAGEAARGLRLDLSGARQLTILADYGDGSDVLDHLLLCDAKVVK